MTYGTLKAMRSAEVGRTLADASALAPQVRPVRGQGARLRVRGPALPTASSTERLPSSTRGYPQIDYAPLACRSSKQFPEKWLYWYFPLFLTTGVRT